MPEKSGKREKGVEDIVFSEEEVCDDLAARLTVISMRIAEEVGRKGNDGAVERKDVYNDKQYISQGVIPPKDLTSELIDKLARFAGVRKVAGLKKDYFARSKITNEIVKKDIKRLKDACAYLREKVTFEPILADSEDFEGDFHGKILTAAEEYCWNNLGYKTDHDSFEEAKKAGLSRGLRQTAKRIAKHAYRKIHPKCMVTMKDSGTGHTYLVPVDTGQFNEALKSTEFRFGDVLKQFMRPCQVSGCKTREADFLVIFPGEDGAKPHKYVCAKHEIGEAVSDAGPAEEVYHIRGVRRFDFEQQARELFASRQEVVDSARKHSIAPRT